MGPRLSPNAFAQLRDFLSREFGLFFDASKATFLENRIFPFLEKLQCLDMNQFIACIQENPHHRRDLLDAITTNETWFFRHPRHFDILRDEILVPLIQERNSPGHRSLSIWSAGSSIGAEAYSIAITVREVLPNPQDWTITIIGSDISDEAIKRANAGTYTQAELKLLSRTLLTRYFIPVGTEAFQVKPDLRSMVTFEQLNLLDPWPDRTFDIIFCRNTMIYFHEETKAALTERFFNVLTVGGTFFTSATETLHWRGDHAFEKIFIHGEYIYRKPGQTKPFVLFRFKTPADLLRALNLLVKSQCDYHLLTIPQDAPNRPRKAIYVPKALEPRVEKMFAEANLKTTQREDILK